MSITCPAIETRSASCSRLVRWVEKKSRQMCKDYDEFQEALRQTREMCGDKSSVYHAGISIEDRKAMIAKQNEEIVAMLKDGTPQKDIAPKLNMSKTGLSDRIRRYKLKDRL